MLTPLPLGLGLRYARARQHAYFVSFISWVSLAGIALGVAALIAILSVMNGFEGELRTRLLSLSAHATLPAAPDAEALRQLAERAREQPGVVSAEPFVEVQGLLSNGSTLSGAVLRGIDARDFRAGTPLADAMIAGDLAALTAGSGRVVLGRTLEIIKTAWDGEAGLYQSPLVVGLAALISRYPNLSRDRMLKALTGTTPAQVIAKARMAKDAELGFAVAGGRRVEALVSEQMANLYNRGLRDASKYLTWQPRHSQHYWTEETEYRLNHGEDE